MKPRYDHDPDWTPKLKSPRRLPPRAAVGIIVLAVLMLAQAEQSARRRFAYRAEAAPTPWAVAAAPGAAGAGVAPIPWVAAAAPGAAPRVRSSIDPAMVVVAPRGIDDRMILAAPVGIDDPMVVDASAKGVR
jgi:hypothetical protein